MVEILVILVLIPLVCGSISFYNKYLIEIV